MGNDDHSKTVVVTSTINVPTFLDSICKNAVDHGMTYLGIVIGDEKTPVEARTYCNRLSEEYGIENKYYDLEDQYRILDDYKEFLDFIPHNNNVRKMIGTWLAYIGGCERVIMIDDDNYAMDGNFIGFHDIVGKKRNINLTSSDSGWFNISETMVEQEGIPFYPRGYPWSKRFRRDQLETSKEEARVIVNGGLVFGDPDIDAVSRLFWPIRVTGFKEEFLPVFGLQEGTWSPFNDQNTAIARELIPVYFKPPSVLRNADIWTSYLIEKLTEGTGDVITYGQPIVEQIRNDHDIRRDYALEEIHNRATDNFVDLLRSIELTSVGYLSRLQETIELALDLMKSGRVFNQEQGKEMEIRHAHLPTSQERLEMELEENLLIRNFFLEYKAWTDIMLKVT
jgi:hypothetical protein